MPHTLHGDKRTGPQVQHHLVHVPTSNLQSGCLTVICNSPLQQCALYLPLPVLQEVEKIRQQSTHEGVHKDGPEYRAKIETAMKDYMPLTVSTISIDTKTSCFLHFVLQWYPPPPPPSCLMDILNSGHL